VFVSAFVLVRVSQCACVLASVRWCWLVLVSVS